MSKTAPYIPLSTADQKRAAGKPTDGGHQYGYASNFGAVRGTASVRGVEGQMVGIIFGEYMRRLVAMSRELRLPEHLVRGTATFQRNMP